jgi:hypothetical protein
MRDLCGSLAMLLIVSVSGCRSNAQGPSIQMGKAVCETCGMTINDARFAALVQEGETLRTYDSIECLLKDRRALGKTTAQGVWMMDFDTQTLHPASAVTIVKGDFRSPMGGGYAAFADQARARTEAESHNGRLGTLDQALSGQLQGGQP